MFNISKGFEDINITVGGEPEWICDTCGEVAQYKANGICYCAKHWEDYLLKT